jgi:23S rRNA (adenine2503-C2)-methyltransferase
LQDAQLIETVLIPASPALYGEPSDRRTICISSQVGCAYGCKFCASGLDGVKRNLTAGEIVAQFLAVEELSGEKINNIVFMGMGEPFANYRNLMQALKILNAPWGLAVGARNMTVSTSGLVPRVIEFADQPLQIRLAVSLHAATDEVRSKIMPVNRKHPLSELMDACEYYCSRKSQPITFEYILIRDLNDTEDQARRLAHHAGRLRAKVNLIPYNHVKGLDWERPDIAVQEGFLGVLKSHGVAATLRREKGHDIAAACGQLRLQSVEYLASRGPHGDFVSQING